MAASSGSDVHRNIAQLLLEEGIFAETDLLEHLGECIEKHKDQAKRARLKRTHDQTKDGAMLTTVVEDINKQLEPLGLKVARMKSRNGSDSGAFQLYYGVVNLDEEDGWASRAG